jgi:hypothetical protein
MLLEEASRKNIEIGFDLNHIPETRWMVTAIQNPKTPSAQGNEL